MTIRLIDDGTLDTVFECSECGKQFRYNYARDIDNEASLNPSDWTIQQNMYDDWINQIIEDETQEHECNQVD